MTQAEGQLKLFDEALLEDAQHRRGALPGRREAHAIPEQQAATQQALVLEDEGTVEIDQGNLEAAQTNLDYTQIRSPIDGQVGLRPVDPSNIVAAGGTTALRHDRPARSPSPSSSTWPRTTWARSCRSSLRPPAAGGRAGPGPANPAGAGLPQHPGQSGQPRDRHGARPNHLRRAKDELFPNQFVNAKLTIKTLTNVVLVPTAAVQRNDTAAYVYVIQPDGTARSQPVTLTASEGDEAAVTGVMPGDALVTDGFEKLEVEAK